MTPDDTVEILKRACLQGIDDQTVFADGQRQVSRAVEFEEPMRCAFCGCTDDDPCIDDWGNACSWISDGLCSECG